MSEPVAPGDALISYRTPAAPRPRLAMVMLAVWGGMYVLLGVGYVALIVFGMMVGTRPRPADLALIVLGAALSGGFLLVWGSVLLFAALRIGRRSFGWAIAGFVLMTVQGGFALLAAAVTVLLPVLARLSPGSAGIPHDAIWVFYLLGGFYGLVGLLSLATCLPLWRAIRLLRRWPDVPMLER